VASPSSLSPMSIVSPHSRNRITNALFLLLHNCTHAIISPKTSMLLWRLRWVEAAPTFGSNPITHQYENSTYHGAGRLSNVTISSSCFRPPVDPACTILCTILIRSLLMLVRSMFNKIASSRSATVRNTPAWKAN